MDMVAQYIKVAWQIPVDNHRSRSRSDNLDLRNEVL